jgi:hypothetical protein
MASGEELALGVEDGLAEAVGVVELEGVEVEL